MSQELLKKAAQATMKEEVPEFRVGDTVSVSVRIVEGEKERVQIFTGTVVGRRGAGVSETFRVRRMVAGQGVERVFPVHSPKIADVKVVRNSKTRRAKLYFLRDRVGKATRLKEVRRVKPKPPAPAETSSGNEA